MATKNQPQLHTLQAHPWHGVSPGAEAPEVVTAYIEIVPTDTVKYELDKETGILRLDRPQRFSSQCPTLYGFIPQTYCGALVAKRCAERTELYARGLELANDFSELTDPVEQRARLVEEQEFRRKAGRAVYPLDERFLDAVGRMPPSAGIAVGLDRILMLLLGVESISDVLLFPAHEFV